MKVDRDKIIRFCEDYLRVDDFKDYCVNGVQVSGTNKIEKIITGVSFSQKLIQAAINKNADMIMVHHGIFINPIGSPPSIKGYMRDRLKELLKNDINLAGFHLPLDAHPMIGNNISLCKTLGVKKTKPVNVGFIGDLEKVVSIEDFIKKVDKKLNTKSISIKAGPKKIKKVGIISGGASPDFYQMAQLGVDVFIAGDIREEIVRAVEEEKINFINAGHYNTEKFGIQNLGELVSKKFGIKVEFVDVPCEV